MGSAQRGKELFWYAIILLAGLLVFGLGLREMYLASASASWPTCPGYVVYSEVKESVRRDIGDAPSYSANVTYKYEVDGKEYTSDTVFFGQYNSGFTGIVKKIVERYPVRKRVTVHYDPRNPQTAVLETGWSWGAFLLATVGLIFAGAGALGIWYATRKDPGPIRLGTMYIEERND